ncbi:Chalcone_isomerase domain-containing protein [Rubrivivax sp. A210]|uniref:chalcone isomerase family protein n=1 Tax=Rubrivivax sp. A210 TaxID=2772301 RepID=UPI00191A3690|nr:chalcone isomerase family protein [Rubrivivax sp. A210]CAD5374582.1 Chalcone_isomerase domain-containing protein [Rubrivivax sp. A210]
MDIPRRTLMLAALLAAVPPLRAQSGAIVYEGERFERRLRVADADLLLNGTGYRGVKWLRVYLVALYLAESAGSAAAALAMAGPKRLQLRMKHDAPAAEFVKALRQGVERNSPPAELPRLAGRLQALGASIAALGKVKAGDVVDLDLHPGRGLLFAVNGKLQAEPLAGDDFYTALLRAFIGERPYDARMRAGLLGLPR